MSAPDGGPAECDLSFSGQQSVNNPDIESATPIDHPVYKTWLTHVRNYLWSLLSLFINHTFSLFSTKQNHTDQSTHVIGDLPISATEVFHTGSVSEVFDTFRDHIIVSADASTTAHFGDSDVNSLSPSYWPDSVSAHCGLLTEDIFLEGTPVLEPFNIYPSESEHNTISEPADCRDSFDANIDHQLNRTQSNSYTVLTACYIDSQNGLIDVQSRDKVVRKILRSVIPRNLSDSSDIFVKPCIRKMYAWTKPEKIFPSDLEGDLGERPKAVEAGSDAGSLSTSCSSLSPLSPSTEESSAPFCPPPGGKPDLHLPPDIDKHGNTLAWAMSNLQIASNSYPKCPTLEYVEKIDKTPNGSPTLSSSRPSRDKNVVNTINSCKLSDTTGFVTLIPPQDLCLAASLYDCDAETIKPKRSSSLKSSRTPPGTPKAVRFADAFGLDLATVKHVFDLETPPKIPASATLDLDLDTDESIAKIGAKQFGLCFAQPGSAPNFIHRVFSQNVCLEDAHVDMPRGVLTGTIRVRSLGFEKRIYVRITYNNWMTFFDTLAGYVQGSHDGATDRFSFSIVFPDTMAPGDKAQFAVRYEIHTGEQCWDNNHGQNYSVTCYAKATDLAGDGSWMHYL